MEKNLLVQAKKKILIYRIVLMILLIILVTITILYALGVGWKEDKSEKESEQKPTEPKLTLWNKDSNSTKNLISYMSIITDKNNEKYIPPEDRIAIFDFDGTIFCETDTIYFDYFMFAHRVLNDSDYNNSATKKERDLALQIQGADIHNLAPNIQMDHARAYPHVYENMTYEELEEYTKNYMEIESPGFKNMKRGGGFYEPMVELIEYLQANDFQIYICSGGDRHIYRTLAKSRLNIPESHVIGTISTVAATGQTNRSDSSYEFKEDDKLIVGGEFKYKNVRMNKVQLMKIELGKKPMLCFGNSSGDYSMCKYVTSDNKYESRAFMICCDDLEREYGDIDKANKVKYKCGNNTNWVSVSMRDDWSRIYPDNVSKK